MGEGNLNKIRGGKKIGTRSEESFPEKLGGKAPGKTETRLYRRKDIGGIKTREGILEFLEKQVNDKTALNEKKRANTELQRAKAVLEGRLTLTDDVIKKPILVNKLREILKLEAADVKSKKDKAIKPDQLFDAIRISDKSFPEEVAAESVTASAGELSAASSGAEAKPPVETEVDSAEPDELEVDSSGVEVFPSEEAEEIRPEAIEPEKDPKSKKPEEGPEEKEKKAMERQSRLAQLKTEVEQARKEYLEIDYKKNKAYQRLGKFFGTLFKEKYESTREDDFEVALYRAHYDAKLLGYQDLLLEDAKERKVSNQKLGLVLKEFLVEKNLNTAETHTEIKIENQDRGILSIFKENSKKITEWYYHSLSKKERLAYGAAFGITLASVAWALPAAAGVAASAATMRRAFSSIVVGTSTALGAESRGISKDKEKIERETEALIKSLEGLSEEKKLELVSEIINRNIKFENDNVVAKIKNRNLRHLAYGVGAGFVTAIVAPRVGKALGGLFGEGWHKISEFWQNNPGGIIEGTGAGVEAGTHVPSGPGVASADAPSVAGVESHAETPSVATVPETGPANEAFHKTFAEGDNVEKSIISYLDEHPEAVDKYNELHGDREFDSGEVAHRMAADFAKEKGIPVEKLDEVYPGQELELSQDGTKIVDISGSDHMGDVPEESVLESTGEEVPEASQAEVETGDSETDSAEETAADEAETSPTEKSDAPQTEQAPEIPAEQAENVVSAPKEVMIEEFRLDDATSIEISDLNAKINDVNVEIGEIDNQIDRIKIRSYTADDFSSQIGMEDELVAEKKRLTEKAFYLIKERNEKYGLSVMRYMSANSIEKWREIKNLPVGDLLEDKKGLVYKFYAKISGYNIENFKGDIKPKSGEIIKDWIVRVVKMRTR